MVKDNVSDVQADPVIWLEMCKDKAVKVNYAEYNTITVFRKINVPGAQADKPFPSPILMKFKTGAPKYLGSKPWKFHWDTIIIGWDMEDESW